MHHRLIKPIIVFAKIMCLVFGFVWRAPTGPRPLNYMKVYTCSSILAVALMRTKDSFRSEIMHIHAGWLRSQSLRDVHVGDPKNRTTSKYAFDIGRRTG